jgi:ADP-ribosylglycohydrolase
MGTPSQGLEPADIERRFGWIEDFEGNDVLAAATAHLKPWSGAEMIELIHAALMLAHETGNYATFRTRYHSQFRRQIACDSRETIPATLALLQLAQGDLSQTVSYAANFGRDTNTIACMAGSIAGALVGTAGLRQDWHTKITRNAVRDQQELAHALLDVGRRKAMSEMAAWGIFAQAEQARLP